MTDRLQRCRVDVRKTLRDALRALDQGQAKIALVTSADGRLLGTVSDGDIRRALLGGLPLESPLEPHMSRDVAAVGPGASRAEVMDLMQARRVEQIPVIDGTGKLLGMHLLHEMLGAIDRPNWAVVMAGGLGLRLRPLTDDVPKPMLKVAGRPILERIVLHLVGFGIRRILIAVNYLPEVIERHFGDGARFGCRIEYLREPRPLGTGGALSLLPEAPKHPLLVLNGDLLTQIDVGAMLELHAAGRHAATVGVHHHGYMVPFGVVEVEGGRVRGIQEKPTFRWRTNSGVYLIEPSLLARIPVGEEFHTPALIEDCLARGEPVGAFAIEGDHVDVGRASELRRARGEEDAP